MQREAILRDPDWKDGAYDGEQPPATGMRIARKLGTMTYRSAAEWKQRFGRAAGRPEEAARTPFAPEFAVQGYLETHARALRRAFDPNCYLYLSRAMDRFDLAAHGESRGAVARAGRAGAGDRGRVGHAVRDRRAACACGDFDRAGITTRFAPLPCIEGHDSFLIDLESFGSEIGTFSPVRTALTLEIRVRNNKLSRVTPAACHLGHTMAFVK